VIHTVSAIVLRPTPIQEGGLVVSFLTELGERKVGLAKGAKRPKAKWVSSFEPLGLVRVSFFGKEHSELKRITRCELQHSPLALGLLEPNLVIACLADLFDRIAKEGVEDERLFRLLSRCAEALKDHPDKAMAVLAYAEHWLLHCLGLLPHPRVCGRCGNDQAPLVLLSEEGGWRCAACTPTDPEEALPPGTREHLRNLRTVGAGEAPLPDGSEAARAVTSLLRDRLLRELGGSLRSYDVLLRLSR
jgi:DNA repair protein RecO